MQTFEWLEFVRLARFSVEWVFGPFFPATAVAIALIPIGALRSLKARSPFPRFAWAWTSLPFVVALLPLVLGTIFWSPTGPNERTVAPKAASWAADSTVLLQCLVSVATLRFSTGWRIYAIGVLLLQWLFLLATSFMAGMAMTGDWL